MSDDWTRSFSRDEFNSGSSDSDAPTSNSNTSFDAILVVPKLYVPAYGDAPPGGGVLGRKKIYQDLAKRTLLAGRPLSRDEYETWGTLMETPARWGAGKDYALLGVLAWAFSTSRTEIWPLHKPKDPAVFPTPWLPLLRGRMALLTWRSARVMYIGIMASTIFNITDAVLTIRAAQQARRDPKLAQYWLDSHDNLAEFFASRSRGGGMFKTGPAGNTARPDNIGSLLDFRTRAPIIPTDVNLAGLQKIRQAYGIGMSEMAMLQVWNLELLVRGRQGTWDRRSSSSSSASQGLQAPTPERQDSDHEARDQRQLGKWQQKWQHEGLQQDSDEQQMGEEKRAGMMTRFPSRSSSPADEKNQSPLQQASATSTSGSGATSDERSGWGTTHGIEDHLDDSPPVAPSHRGMQPGAAGGSSWDRIRQQSRSQSGRQAQQSWQQSLQQQQQQQQRSGSTWSDIRGQNRGQNRDQSMSGGDDSSEARAQAQKDFDAMLDKERQSKSDGEW